MIKGPKGAPDILPDKSKSIRVVIDKIIKIVENFGYKEIILPIFEHSEVFERTVGEDTDIVEKEMYTFFDKSGMKLSLRPEGTAQTVRAYLENNLKTLTHPVKFFYFGPMFRYERPQKGRFRQFFHFGIEALGDEKPELDVEVISISLQILESLGLKDLSVSLNSIGDIEERNVYKEKLKSFLRKRYSELCDDCKKRLEKNPLRILDCKKESCINVTKDAPKIIDYLSNESKNHFEKILSMLDDLKIKYEINNRLVRGLDYYNRTVFEVFSSDLGAQNAVLGGGRYDYLSEYLGGDRVPGVGFAMGVERLIMLLENKNLLPKDEKNIIFISPLSKEYFEEAFKFYINLGKSNFSLYFPYNFKNIKTSISNALKMNIDYMIIYGGDELKNGFIIFKDLIKEEQQLIKIDNLLNFLNNYGGF
ncbi:histidine--tRNA ligase [bacterium]|nr:histidine--tRNA ligase [bacterium]